jgi:hypothetical protein
MKLDSVRFRRRALLAAPAIPALAFLVAGCATGGRPAASRQSSAAACPAAADDPSQVVDARRPAQDPKVLESVAAGMCLSDVLGRLGPAHRFTGSGVFVFEWKSTDGRTLQVGAPGLRDKAAYVRWAGGS